MHTGRSSRFPDILKRLSPRIRAAFFVQELRLAADPRDPRLHLKKLEGKYADAYSIRIAGSYRALFIWSNDFAFFFDIDNRKDIYRD